MVLQTYEAKYVDQPRVANEEIWPEDFLDQLMLKSFPFPQADIIYRDNQEKIVLEKNAQFQLQTK